MQVNFYVSDVPVLTVQTNVDQTAIEAVAVDDALLAELAFPAVAHDPTINDLLVVLRSYIGAENDGLNLAAIAERTGGQIPYIEFRENLRITLI